MLTAAAEPRLLTLTAAAFVHGAFAASSCLLPLRSLLCLLRSLLWLLRSLRFLLPLRSLLMCTLLTLRSSSHAHGGSGSVNARLLMLTAAAVVHGALVHRGNKTPPNSDVLLRISYTVD